jgi:hypothetical protein
VTLQLGLIDIRQYDFGAVLCHDFGVGEAEAGSRAGDKGDVILDVEKLGLLHGAFSVVRSP